MAFILHKGKVKTMYFKKDDTTREVRNGGLVVINDSGSVAPPMNDSNDKIVGVCRANDTVTDSAFNTNGDQGSCPVGFVPVEVAVENFVEYLIDLDSDAGAADSDVGRQVSADTTGGNSVNAGDSAGMRLDISDSASPHVFITGIVSASRVTGVIMPSAITQSFDT